MKGKLILLFMFSVAWGLALEPLKPLISPEVKHIGWLSESSLSVPVELVNENPFPVWIKKVLMGCDCASLQTVPADLHRRALQSGEKGLFVLEFYEVPFARDVSFQYAVSDSEDGDPVYFDAFMEIRRQPAVWLSASEMKWVLDDQALEARTVQILNRRTDEAEIKLKFNENLIEARFDSEGQKITVRPLVRRSFTGYVEIFTVENGVMTLAGSLKVALVSG